MKHEFFLKKLKPGVVLRFAGSENDMIDPQVKPYYFGIVTEVDIGNPFRQIAVSWTPPGDVIPKIRFIQIEAVTHILEPVDREIVQGPVRRTKPAVKKRA